MFTGTLTYYCGETPSITRQPPPPHLGVSTTCKGLLQGWDIPQGVGALKRKQKPMAKGPEILHTTDG